VDPVCKTILGGTGVSWGIHVWTADTQTPARRQQWQQTLDNMAAHKPERVIPGHYLGLRLPEQARLIYAWLSAAFEQALSAQRLRGRYRRDEKTVSGSAEESSLELSAKVNTGEMKW
jgi:glyoxylase-like metal-dependent hydrolase (beta-lactamase superfamily II)